MRVEGIRAAGHGAHGTRQKIPDKGRRTGEYSCTYYVRAPLELRDLSNDFWVAGRGFRKLERERGVRMEDDGRRKLLRPWKLCRLDAEVACPICNGLHVCGVRRGGRENREVNEERGRRTEEATCA